MIDVPILVAAITLLLYSFYRSATINRKYFEKLGLPYAKPTFLFGNTVPLYRRSKTSNEYLTNLYNLKPNEKICGMFDYREPFVLIRDPEILKQLTIKDFDHFEDHRQFINEKADVLFGNSLFMLRGKKWRDMRATLSPAFTSSKMRQMFELVTETAKQMSEHFQEESESGKSLDFEMKDLFSRYTNDVIATTAFGVTVNSFKYPENKFFLAGKNMLNFASAKVIAKIMMITFFPYISQLLGLQFISKGTSKFFKSMILDNMKTREEQGIFRPDMINILMQVQNGTLSQQSAAVTSDENESSGFATVEESKIGRLNVNRKWSENEIVAQCFLFFLAGFDTSSTLLSFTAHELAINSDIQDTLYQEIIETEQLCKGQRVSYDLLQKMKYLDQVICESLRKWPPAAIIDRICVKDYEYNDGTTKFKIEKGLYCSILIYAFHHDPAYFPNPEKFDPERFSNENKDLIIPGTYIPFGIGPRNCIGSRFALMEAKAVIYYLLLNFRLEPNEKTQIPLKLCRTPGIMLAEKGIHVRFVKR